MDIKLIFALVILLSFAVMAMFGFAIMKHENGHGHTGCVAAVAQMTGCPIQAGSLSMSIFHLNTFFKFSSIVLENGILPLVLALFLYSLIIILKLCVKADSFRYLLKYWQSKLRFLGGESSLKKDIHWLALHENSPNAF